MKEELFNSLGTKINFLKFRDAKITFYPLFFYNIYEYFANITLIDFCKRFKRFFASSSLIAH